MLPGRNHKETFGPSYRRGWLRRSDNVGCTFQQGMVEHQCGKYQGVTKELHQWNVHVYKQKNKNKKKKIKTLS